MHGEHEETAGHDPQEFILKSGVIGFSTKRRVRCFSQKSLTLVIEVINKCVSFE